MRKELKSKSRKANVFLGIGVGMIEVFVLALGVILINLIGMGS
jgi:hypothetical protein